MEAAILIIPALDTKRGGRHFGNVYKRGNVYDLIRMAAAILVIHARDTVNGGRHFDHLEVYA